MAFTATLLKENVMGNQRVAQYKVSADAVSGIVATKMGVIDAIAVSPISMNSGGPKFKINCTTAAAASNGILNIADVTSGDDLFVTVYGR